MSGIPRGLILFNIFVGDMDSGIKWAPCMFADDNKLSGADNTLQGRDVIQKESLEKWADANLIKFNKVRC